MATKNPYQIIKESSLSVSIRKKGNSLQSVLIQISGTAADIPSLKNSKIPGTNFINKNTMAKLVAMDALYRKACPEKWTFLDEPVHLLYIAPPRTRSFDLDNAQASIRDWLEPCTKPVGRTRHPRGWGIGLVEDDAQITGYALHAKDSEIAFPTPRTIILIQRMNHVKPLFMQFALSLLSEHRSLGDLLNEH